QVPKPPSCRGHQSRPATSPHAPPARPVCRLDSDLAALPLAPQAEEEPGSRARGIPPQPATSKEQGYKSGLGPATIPSQVPKCQAPDLAVPTQATHPLCAEKS